MVTDFVVMVGSPGEQGREDAVEAAAEQGEHVLHTHPVNDMTQDDNRGQLNSTQPKSWTGFDLVRCPRLDEVVGALCRRVRYRRSVLAAAL